MNLDYEYIALKSGQIPFVLLDERGNVSHSQYFDELHLIPGSFNPLHDSHKEIYDFAWNIIGSGFAATSARVDLAYEISLNRIGKPSLTEDEILFRKSQFINYASVIFCDAARFIDKIKIYKQIADNVVFHIGADCVTRMKDDYGLDGLASLEAEFYVYDRIVSGELKTAETELEGRQYPNWYRAGLKRTEESLKRSSTNIRKQT